MALVLDITRATLEWVFKKELKEGRLQTKYNVLNTAYELAVSGKCPAMTMFWIKTQCEWSETGRVASEENGQRTHKNLKLNTKDPIEAAKRYQQFMSET